MARRNKQQRRVRADIATGAPQPQLQIIGRCEAQVCDLALGAHQCALDNGHHGHHECVICTFAWQRDGTPLVAAADVKLRDFALGHSAR